MNTTQIGRKAEAQAAAYLVQHGFQILDQNWRTRYCEIDIVAAKDGTIYFVEVKYRSRVGQGSGLEYITTAKLRKMRFAARLWSMNSSPNNNYELAAIEVTPVDLSFVLI